MGVIWSGLVGRGGEDYEKILSDLNTRVKELEVKLQETRQTERKWILWILLYGSLLYVLMCLYVFFYPRDLVGEGVTSARTALDAAILLTMPIAIYYLRRIVAWAYGKRMASLENGLKSLRAKQKLKVEELKKITSYYRTKGLIEQYDLDEEGHPKKGASTTTTTATTKSQSPYQKQTLDKRSASAPAIKEPETNPSTSHPTHTIASPSPSPSAVPVPSVNPPQTWLDRLVDALLGDDRTSKYALICQKCLSHNGLARMEEFDYLQYICPHCHHLNIPRKMMIHEAEGGRRISEISRNHPSSSSLTNMMEPSMMMLPSMSLESSTDNILKQEEADNQVNPFVKESDTEVTASPSTPRAISKPVTVARRRNKRASNAPSKTAQTLTKSDTDDLPNHKEATVKSSSESEKEH